MLSLGFDLRIHIQRRGKRRRRGGEGRKEEEREAGKQGGRMGEFFTGERQSINSNFSQS